MSWEDKIKALRRMLNQVDSMWPTPSTKLAGYAEDGPYHCEDCKYLKGKKEGKIFRDSNGKGRCNQPVMMADSEVTKDSQHLAIVNIEKGCCEFVDPPKK